MKKTVSVSIDEDVLEKAKETAWSNRMTFSQYVESKIGGVVEGCSGPLRDPINMPKKAKLPHKDLVVEGWRDPRDTVIDSDGKTQNEVISEHLKNQVEDLVPSPKDVFDFIKPDREISTKKGPVKANAALESFFKPQPKAKWKGAK